MAILNAVDLMLKYSDIMIGSQEIPGEASLVINITNCPFRCKGCNAKQLWEDFGEPLSYENLNMLIDSTLQDITCVLFMGGDIAPDEINELASHIRANYPELKIAWYSGGETITVFTEYKNFDYLKFGPFIQKLGPLTSTKTNQRLYRVEGGVLRNITRLLW